MAGQDWDGPPERDGDIRTRRIWNVLHDLRLLKHGPRAGQLMQDYDEGRLDLGEVYDQALELTGWEADAARLTRAISGE